MRYIILILLVLGPLDVHASSPYSDREYIDMPAVEWLGLPYRQQIKCVKAIILLNKIEMCHKQVLEAVNCMRSTGTSPDLKGSKAGSLFSECASDMGVDIMSGAGLADCALKPEKP